MSEINYECPGCGSRIALSSEVAAPTDFGTVGCKNVEDHEDGKPLVMYADGDRP